ncbi:lysophospholipid acyltransferase family protein [Zestomonas carbonaria]|uniref:1-acyl-sn-glycerol-3-phosphate acyltransferase n=1 Tax=Zestomonas carbonaria TaxID=2762745 RepID=A0A7U7EMG0_9GAMM|nr:lysophospholipid acyltransferase family protein [Pseudomonas carbonaria]CAD5107719.1 1-acyl-sn-glycerol-3-phosphate acyltransferase [Pseudomonas carbonaria]
MLRLQPVTESATLARRLGVVLGSFLVTLYYCLVVIFRAQFGRLTRRDVDGYTRRWSSLLLRLVRVRLDVQGPMPDFNDGRRYLILCNHSSHYDIPASFVALPGSIRMLTKKELFRIPFFGRAMRAAEFPSLDRHNRYQALKDLETARKMMESGIVLWAAPEGTRSRDGQLLPFKKGCFHLALDTQAVIIPVAISGIHKVLPARTWHFNLGQAVRLQVGEPLDASVYSVERLDELMDETRARMQALLDQPVVEVTAASDRFVAGQSAP